MFTTRLCWFRSGNQEPYLGAKLPWLGGIFFYIPKPCLFISEQSPDGAARTFPKLLCRGVIRTHVETDWDLSDTLPTELQRFQSRLNAPFSKAIILILFDDVTLEVPTRLVKL